MKLTIDQKNKKAIIELDLQEPRASATGNTVSVAEVRNQFSGIKHENGKELKVSAQVYFKP